MIRTHAQSTIAAQQQAKRSAEQHYQQQRSDVIQARDRLTRTRGEQADAANRAAANARNQPVRQAENAASSAAPEMFKRQATAEEGELFSALLEEDEPKVPFQLEQQNSGDQNSFASQLEGQNDSQPAGMVLWQQLEPELSEPLLSPTPPDQFSLTMLLPKLGQVEARFNQSGAAGWEISLGFTPAALAALRPHRERCRLSLRQRLEKPVRLRFSLLEEEAQETV